MRLPPPALCPNDVREALEPIHRSAQKPPLIADLADRRNPIRGLRRSAAPVGPGQRLIGAGADLQCGTVFRTGLRGTGTGPTSRITT